MFLRADDLHYNKMKLCIMMTDMLIQWAECISKLFKSQIANNDITKQELIPIEAVLHPPVLPEVVKTLHSSQNKHNSLLWKVNFTTHP